MAITIPLFWILIAMFIVNIGITYLLSWGWRSISSDDPLVVLMSTAELFRLGLIIGILQTILKI